MSAAIKTFPADIRLLARGKAQTAILSYLNGARVGQLVDLTQIAAARDCRGLHFSQIMSACDALTKRGILNRADSALGGDAFSVVPHTHAA